MESWYYGVKPKIEEEGTDMTFAVWFETVTLLSVLASLAWVALIVF